MRSETSGASFEQPLAPVGLAGLLGGEEPGLLEPGEHALDELGGR